LHSPVYRFQTKLGYEPADLGTLATMFARRSEIDAGRVISPFEDADRAIVTRRWYLRTTQFHVSSKIIRCRHLLRY
jgi:hypothetical protein